MQIRQFQSQTINMKFYKNVNLSKFFIKYRCLQKY